MYAVPVFTGMVQRVNSTSTGHSGTAEMASYLSLGNPFFDDTTDLSNALIKQNDIVFDSTTHLGTTIVKTGQDFIYMLGQAASTIGNGNTFYIGDASTNAPDTVNVHSHALQATSAPPIVAPPQYNYTSGGTTFYTDHDWTPPVGPAWMGVGDIVRRDNNSTYARLNTLTMRTPITHTYTGTADNLSDNIHLSDGLNLFLNVDSNDYVVNNTENAFTTVSSNFLGFLTLNLPGANFSNNDIYHTFDLDCTTHITQINQFNSFYEFVLDFALGIAANSATVYDYTGITGTADPIPTNPLCDNQGIYNTPLGNVSLGDVVLNYSTPGVATVNDTGITMIYPAGYNHALGLTGNIITGNDNYEIIRLLYTNTTEANIVINGHQRLELFRNCRTQQTPSVL